MDSNDTGFKKCNFCGENIPYGAGRCPYCGSLLETTSDTVSSNVPEGNPHEDGAGARADSAYAYSSAPGNNPPGYGGPGDFGGYKRKPLGNGLKVFLTLVFALIPGIGQLAGIITAIVFMNADDDPDRKSFGLAILVASLIMFVFACIGCFIAAITFSVNTPSFQGLQ